MAEGLQRMFSRAGVNSSIFVEGLADLERLPDTFHRYIRENGPGSVRIARRIARYLLIEAPALYRLVRKLQRFDVIVVVNSIPKAFMRSFFKDATLRGLVPHVPIVLYSLFYLPTRGLWNTWLQHGNPKRGVPSGGNWALERYDWYLCASDVSDTAMPPGPQPYTVVGLDLDDRTLFPEPKEDFVALIDFECPEYMAERAVQIQACEQSHTKYIVLNGRYSINRIRSIYRKTSAYFPAMRESFGLPICELQACGSNILTPYARWCPSHTLKANCHVDGLGQLPPNFIVYDNDVATLVAELHRLRQTANPLQVVSDFRQCHPQFFSGDDEAVSDFVAKVRDGIITSRSHIDNVERPVTPPARIHADVRP